jgi:hypothetical protein
VLSDSEKLRLLELELAKWQSFRITGLCNIHYQSFNIRQPFSAAMHEGRFRFDIYNTGILGAISGTMMSVYIDDNELQFRALGSSNVEVIRLNNDYAYLKYISMGLVALLANYKDTIVRTGKASVQGFDFSFNENMQLKEIVNRTQALNVRFDHNSNSVVTDVSVNIPIVRNLNIEIDKFEISKNPIQSLR